MQASEDIEKIAHAAGEGTVQVSASFDMWLLQAKNPSSAPAVLDVKLIMLLSFHTPLHSHHAAEKKHLLLAVGDAGCVKGH